MENKKNQQEGKSTIEKKMLTFKEACEYAGIKPSYMHKLTAARRIPFSKPCGKKIYFDKAELDEWMRGNRVKTIDEINDEAARYGKQG